MAEVKGYKCDRVECGTFAASEGGRPPGWVQLCVHPKVPRPVGGFADARDPDHRPTPGKDNCIDLCGNVCLALVALERAEVDGTKVPGWQKHRGGRKVANGPA